MEMPKSQNQDREARLRWINRLLKSSATASSEQNKNSNRNGRDSNSVTNVTNVNNCNNNVCLSATMNESSDASQQAGVFVVADRDLEEGTMVLSCGSEGFVLETPEHRRNYCSYCSRKKHDALPLMFCLNCLDRDGNPMVGYCSDCTGAHKLHHIDSPVECRVLQCLRATTTGYDASSDEEDVDDETTVTNQCVTEIFRSSVALLAIKLISRQIHVMKNSTTTTLQPDGDATSASNTINNNNSGADEPSSSFFPPSWLDRFRLLYEHTLPDQGPYSAISTLLNASLHAVVEDTTNISYVDLIRSTLGRILGCSHAIVDPSLPLGKQTLGRAIYACHSFYNHSCTPNAYLSTIHPQASPSSSSSSSSNINNNNNANNNTNNDPSNDPIISCSPQGLTGRIHLLRPVARGEEITLSYIPLSGLSRQERMDSLKASYGFSCSCSVCSDNHHPLVLPPNTVVADIDAIRQIQFGLNDKLHDLSHKWIKDLRYSIIRREHERIRRRMRRSEAKENRGVVEKKDPGMVLQMDRILRRIEMTQKGIANQNLPECHEVSIEADRLTAAACDLWLRAMGESLCVSVESAFEAHFEFWRKTEQIQGLFDPVALGTQCLASSVSCILRAKEKQKKRQLLLKQQEEERKKKNDNDSNSNDNSNDNNNNNNNKNNNDTNHQEDIHQDNENDEGIEEMQLSQSERKRGLKILSTCLGSDHPWVQKLKSDATASAQGLLITAQENDRKPAASPKGEKRRRI